MTAAFTIILPHQINHGNNESLKVCMDCLTANTCTPHYNILMDLAVDEHLYTRINRLFKQAETDCCIFWNSDMFAAPGWDLPMLKLYGYNTIVTNVLVEPGAIGVHHQNLHRDFGRKPWTFRRDEFENWTQTDAPMLDGEGWYAPYMMSRQRFLDLGCIEIIPADAAHGFNNRPLDIELFERHKANGGTVIRARSYVYHLQRWSDEDEQNHEKRDRSE